MNTIIDEALAADRFWLGQTWRVVPKVAWLAMLASCGGSVEGPVLPSTGAPPGAGVGQNGGTSVFPADSGASPALGDNVLDVIVDSGPQDVGYVNGLFATITVCQPGTRTCQTVDHVLVDTGSVGVRLLDAQLALNLPVSKNTTGQSIAECTPFVDGTAWGPVRMADVEVGGERSANLPIQLIGELSYAMPADCSGTPITDFRSLSANGILGIGTYLQDCGSDCALAPQSGKNPGVYYACSAPKSAGCVVTAVPASEQVQNPVAFFAADNNGIIIRLPPTSPAGMPSVPGTLIFGIGTQANNGLAGAQVLALDAYGFISTSFPAGGQSYTSYLDSGSNALFFLNAGSTNLSLCLGNERDFYCPEKAASLTANLGNAVVAFTVANAESLAVTNYAFDDLAGPMPGFPTDPSVPGFDWGLPFFFGRSVYTAIEGQSTPAGPGPYFAF